MALITKNKAELLKLFFTNPDRSFYMQEVGKIIGKKPGTFQRTLNNMAKEGILTSEYRGNARYFKANKNYPLFKELKSIVFKTIGVSGSLKEVLEKMGNIKFAFIYGSYAKSKETYLSDIDLLIIGNPNEDELIKELDRLEKKLQREINYKLYSIIEFKRDVAKKEPFILYILRNKKVMLIGNENGLQKISKK